MAMTNDTLEATVPTALEAARRALDLSMDEVFVRYRNAGGELSWRTLHNYFNGSTKRPHRYEIGILATVLNPLLRDQGLDGLSLPEDSPFRSDVDLTVKVKAA